MIARGQVGDQPIAQRPDDRCQLARQSPQAKKLSGTARRRKLTHQRAAAGLA